MSVSLQKGQKVDLTKGNAGLKRLIVGLGWDAAEQKKGLFGMKKASEITEDDLKDGENELQKITDKFIKEIDDVAAKKQKEVMEI